ncbi:hypothetical protein ABPG74_018611 [Tetrahymena malaccensis]
MPQQEEENSIQIKSPLQDQENIERKQTNSTILHANSQYQTEIYNSKKEFEYFSSDASDFEEPTVIECPKCLKVCQTKIQVKSGKNTYLCSGLLFVLSVGLCCVLPLLSSGFKDKIHFCSACGNQVGIHKFRIC